MVERGDSEEVMPCLIEHKYNMEMNEKCRASIEHWQLVSIFKYWVGEIVVGSLGEVSDWVLINKGSYSMCLECERFGVRDLSSEVGCGLVYS